MSIKKRIKTSTAAFFATGILFAGGQDLTSESDLDFTGRRPQDGVQRPVESKSKSKRNSFCILDIETTGFHTERDAIIEVAAIKVDMTDTEWVTDEFQAFVRPPRNIPGKISELTGITNEMVANADAIDRVIPELKAFLGNRVLVAHNASFDRRFLEKKANLMGITFADHDWTCSLMMAKRAWPSRGQHSLASFAAELDVNQTHRAIDDCRITLEVYLSAYEELGGNVHIKPLEIPEFEIDSDEEAVDYDADLENEVFVFSGFRDDVLAARIENCGGAIKGNISRKVTKLLVESIDLSTGKVKKAREYGIEVQTRVAFEDEFYFPEWA